MSLISVRDITELQSSSLVLPTIPPTSVGFSRTASLFSRSLQVSFGLPFLCSSFSDIWSTGCVMAELMQGQPLFPGESGIDQLVEIIKVLGTPTREQIKTMNPNYMEHKFPQIRPHPFSKVFRPRTDPGAIDLISRLLEYTPSARLTAIEALCHPFFDELRTSDAPMPNGREVPPLFNWTKEGELLFSSRRTQNPCREITHPSSSFPLFFLSELSIRPDLISKLVPPQAEAELMERGIDVHNFEPVSLESLRVTLD